MDKDLEQFINSQNEFQKAVLENIKLSTENIQALNERIKLAHERMDLQEKHMDAILESMRVMRYELNTLQEWKLAKEGI